MPEVAAVIKVCFTDYGAFAQRCWSLTATASLSKSVCFRQKLSCHFWITGHCVTQL